METHPVPQNISSYQFRLVGDMTLKQFFQVAGGVLVGLLFYSTSLPGIIKWFFIIFFGLIGIALAFLPFEDRPLEKWILSFLRSVYSPTIFNWQQTTARPLFSPETSTLPVGETKPALSTLDKNEVNFLSQIAQNFQPQAGNLVMPVASPITISPVKNVIIPQTNFISVAPPPKPRIIVEETSPQPPLKTDRPLPGVTVADLSMGISFANSQANAAANQPAQFSPEAAPPNPPTIPNTITGQTLDESGKIIEGAIMEIRDSAGRPVRALKTNKLGHFIIVTPLINGKYEIIIDKDGYTFEPLSFEVQGNMVPPIMIIGKKITV